MRSQWLVLALCALSGRTLYGQTELFRAIYDNDVRQLQQWLDVGSEPNVRDAKGQTPLLQVVNQVTPVLDNRSLMAALLIEYGADVDANMDDEARHLYGFTPLMGAVSRGFYDLSYYFLNEGAYVNAVRTGVCPTSALWLAAYCGKADVVWLLLQFGADRQFKGGCYQETPLEVATRLNKTDVVRLLQ